MYFRPALAPALVARRYWGFAENEELQMKFLAGSDFCDAQAAHGASVGLTDAVRAACTNGAAAPVVAAASGGQIGDAPAKFSDATYPIMQKIDWGNTPLISKYIARHLQRIRR